MKLLLLIFLICKFVKELCLSLDITYGLHNLSTTSRTTARTFFSCHRVTHKSAGTGLWHEM